MSERDRPTSATAALVASFESYDRHELADMLAHVVKTYVMDGTTPNRPELGIIDFPRHLRELNFPDLIAHLKMHLDLPELNLFTVAGNDVLVKLAERDYSLTTPQRGPAPQPPPREESGAAREEPPAREEKTREEPPREPDQPAEVSDRFRMLELD